MQKYSNNKVKYIQEFLVEKFCKDWTTDDRIIIFLTEKAKQTNWEDNGHQNRKTGETIENKGLSKRLKDINKDIRIETPTVNIGMSEKEIWGNFNMMYEQFEEGDEIIFDVTHGLRSFSILMMVFINYLKVLKNVTVSNIFYGAFEVSDTLYKPVLDLNTYSELQDWTNAINDFVKNGISEDLKKLTRERATEMFKTKTITEIEKSIVDIINNLYNFTNKIFMPNGLGIVRSNIKEIVENNIKKINEELEEIDKKHNTVFSALVPLLESVKEKTEKFKKDDYLNGFRAVEWCIEHNLIQQAYTILREFIMSYILEKLPVEEGEEKEYKWDTIDENIRDRGIGSVIRIVIRERNNKEEDRSPKTKEINATEEIRDDIKNKYLKLIEKQEEFYKIAESFQNINDFRNSLNHAGFTTNNITKFKEKIEEEFEKIKTNVIKIEGSNNISLFS